MITWYIIPQYNNDGEPWKKVKAKSATDAFDKYGSSNTYNPRRPRKIQNGVYIKESKYDASSQSSYRGIMAYTKDGMVKYHGEKVALEDFQSVGIVDLDAWKDNADYLQIETEQQRSELKYKDYEDDARLTALFNGTVPKSLEDVE